MKDNKKNKRIDVYNKRDVYDKDLAPLINKIKIICWYHKIPFVISTAVENTEEKTDYVHEGVLTGSRDINLYEDNFVKYLLALNGGKFVTDESFDMQEVCESIDEELAALATSDPYVFKSGYFDNDEDIDEEMETDINEELPDSYDDFDED